MIRLELHHLWNPDWTYSFPQSNDPNVVFDGDYYAYDEYTPNEAAAEGPTSEDSSMEEEE